ncbi:hypothetical protein VTK73DRAFT_18 [Phialemonium thermophilum]|uniref:Uncharacterized protein n=1 Tax=Phialemonium thermophilum TaxID=223376 RepID=A0ABR3Y8F9_9PEZI
MIPGVSRRSSLRSEWSRENHPQRGVIAGRINLARGLDAQAEWGFWFQYLWNGSYWYLVHLLKLLQYYTQ